MSSIEELRELLKKSQEENKKIQQEKEQAEEEKKQAQNLIRNTTLKEYLRACQEHVLSKIDLKTDGYLTTKAPTTNPTRKHCPHLLTPWVDFIETQNWTNTMIDKILPRNEQLFESVHFLETIGNRVRERKVSSESDLIFIQNNCIEDPVRIILSKLKNFGPERHNITIGNGVYFQTAASNLRDPSDNRESIKRDTKLRTDQICVLRDATDRKDIAYVIEYKAPHKLHKAHLDLGLREMSIVDEVVNKPTIPKLDPERFQHYAELLSAAAVTQTYHYMLEAGLEYGYLTNGDVIVFLKIDWADPSVLLFHLARPADEVVADENPIYSNAVSQVLAFTVLALQSRQHSNDERTNAVQRSAKWVVDFSEILDKIAEEEKSQGGPHTPEGKKHRRVPSSPEYVPRPVKRVNRGPGESEEEITSDRVLRSHRRRRDGPGGGSGSAGGSAGGGSAGGGSAGGGSAGGGSTEGTNQGDSSQRGLSQPAGSSTHTNTPLLELPQARPSVVTEYQKLKEQMQRRPYCTPLCLLTLLKGRWMDEKCPNVALHRGNGDVKPRKHPVSHEQWMALLGNELSQSLDRGMMALGQEGACGAIFKMTLLQYGYTFVAKGVTGSVVPTLLHEEKVYQKLEPLQGRRIPVCLGTMDLQPLGQMFFYDLDVRIIYLLFMSYAGSAIKTKEIGPEMQTRMVTTVSAVLDEMHSLGVVHGDVRLPNVLLGPTGQVSVIDFDRAKILPTTATVIRKRTLSAISPNKRKHLEDAEDVKPSSAALDAGPRTGFAMDESDARTLFVLDNGRPL